MVVHPSAFQCAVAAAKEVGTVQHMFVFGDHAVDDIQPYTRALLGNRLAEPVPRKADDLAYLCFSSGTTGMKGLDRRHISAHVLKTRENNIRQEQRRYDNVG